MASVRAQILAAVETKLAAVLVDLAWETLVVNPREVIPEEDFNVIALEHGGDREPNPLTGHVEQRWLEFSVGWIVVETADDAAEDLLDEGFVAISDALLDPADIQLGGLAVAIEQGGISDPMIGRSQSGARMIGAQAMDFSVQYLAREGDASTAGP